MVRAVCAAEGLKMSAASYLEAAIVVDRRGDPVLSRRLDALLERPGVEIVDVTPGRARIARAAHRDFGRGSGHPARLGFGDCLSYALAMAADDKRLCIGDHITHTDIRRSESR